MAKFKSIVTDTGANALTALIAAGENLTLTRAAAGSGVADVSPNTLSDLVTPGSVKANLVGKEFVPGTPAVMRITIQLTNETLTAESWVREVGVYGEDINGDEILFCYGWLDGEDSDNVLPATSFVGEADTVHIHNIAVFLTGQEAAIITVQVGAGTYITETQLEGYAAPINHTQPASTVNESTGETTEQAQRRQDNAIAGLLEQLDTNFTGTTVIHTFAPGELSSWVGYNGSGLPEGVLDTVENRLYY